MKKSGSAQPVGRRSSLLAAVASRSYTRPSSEVEGKLDRGELTEEQAFSLVANARESLALQGYRSVAAFVAAVGLLRPFLRLANCSTCMNCGAGSRIETRRRSGILRAGTAYCEHEDDAAASE